MKNLRRSFDRFCFQNRNKGIPNLMLYIAIGSGIVYFMTEMAQNPVLYQFLYFDRALILKGQVWRLFSYVLTYSGGNIIYTAIGLLCYYSLGRAIENRLGTFRFNLFYLSGVVLMDIYCLVFSGRASVTYLNMSLFLAYATLYPDTHFLLFFIIPVKAWIFAVFDLAMTLMEVITMSIPVFYFPHNFFPLVAIANYLLFFGGDIGNIFPMSWRINARRLFKKKSAPQGPKVVPFPSAGSYQATTAAPKAPHLHKCTICGRTDISHPDLEFRYCSRCNGYHCYCEEHISNHTHIQ